MDQWIVHAWLRIAGITMICDGSWQCVVNITVVRSIE